MSNIIPAQSAEFEGAGTGNWVNWFSTTVSKSTEQASNGTGSMKVVATATFWGVTINNWPGYSAGVQENHEYEISWAMHGNAAVTGTATLRVHWRNEGGTNLLTTSVPITLGALGGWVQSDPVLATSPAGTTRMFFELERTGGFSGGGTFHMDSFIVEDSPAGGAIPEVTASIPLTLDVSGETAAVHDVSASIPMGLSVDATSEITHDVSASVSLPLSVTPESDAVHQSSANISLGIDVSAESQIEHQSAASIPLEISVSPIADAPSVGGANVTAQIPLSMALSADTQSEREVTSEIILGIDVSPATSATRDISSEILLGLDVNALTSTIHDISSAILLELELAATSEGVKEVTAEIPLGVTVDAATSTTRIHSWSRWNGIAEEPLFLDGMWDGEAIVSLTYDRVVE